VAVHDSQSDEMMFQAVKPTVKLCSSLVCNHLPCKIVSEMTKLMYWRLHKCEIVILMMMMMMIFV